MHLNPRLVSDALLVSRLELFIMAAVGGRWGPGSHLL